MALWCQDIDFPGGKVAFTCDMRFISESAEKRVPCYRVLDDNGDLMPYSDHVQVSQYLFKLGHRKLQVLFLAIFSTMA